MSHDIWCISRWVLPWCMVNTSTLCILGHLWFDVSMTRWLDVVRGLLCQWLCDWMWYEVWCVKESVTGRGTRFVVSMSWDWTWYELCCVSDTVTGRGTRFAVSMTQWLDVVRGLLCQCPETGRGTRFAVSMTLWLDMVRVLLCQWLCDWMVWSSCIYSTYEHASWRTSPYSIRQVDIYGN